SVGGARHRYTTFAAGIGLGTLTSGRLSGDTPALRGIFRQEVFNGALAYAAGTGRRLDVVNVLNDPGPGILAPTFWEAYWNISGWVVDIFIARLAEQVAREQSGAP